MLALHTIALLTGALTSPLLTAATPVAGANETSAPMRYITDVEWAATMVTWGVDPGDNNNTISSDAVNGTDVDKRAPDGGIYICWDADWKDGTCAHANQPYDVCIQLTNPWYKSISSFGPDSWNAAVLYEDNYCSSANSKVIWHPGMARLSSIGWNDRVGSFLVRYVSVHKGRECWFGDLPNNMLPGETCGRCCWGCVRSGQGCCWAGDHAC